MREIHLKHSRGTCTIFIERGLITRLGELIRGRAKVNICGVITDRGVWKFWGRRVWAFLRLSGFRPYRFVIQPGELQKDLRNLERIYLFFARSKFERGSPIFALGGGVIGDLAGFSAATYMRGLPFFQVPTTLTAQVDSSIGGKTGINLGGKNLIGTFYQPEAVFVDPGALDTLPLDRLKAEVAEVIKYGIICDPWLLDNLEKGYKKFVLRDSEFMEEIILRCIKIKVRIVEKDEYDRYGIRAVLNYGHTLGHAIEAALSGEGLSHPEAVALGMEYEARIAVGLGIAPREVLLRQRRLFNLYNLPAGPIKLPVYKISKFIPFDKKIQDRKLRMALPEGMGKVKFPVIVSSEVIKRVLRDVCSD